MATNMNTQSGTSSSATNNGGGAPYNHNNNLSTSSFPEEFQAVILSMENEPRLSPLTDNLPKSLLPIGNRPLILYQVELLRRAGFDKVIVVITKESEALMTDFIRLYRDLDVEHLEIELFTLSDGLGSADALRCIKHKLKSDFLVLSGDLITDVIIHYLADYHRINDSAVTMLLSKIPPGKENARKKNSKGKSKKSNSDQKEGKEGDSEPSPLDEIDDADRYYVSVVKKENRLLYFRSTADIEYLRFMHLCKGLLRKTGNLTVQSDLRDAQLVIFSRWVLDLLELKENISSIQGELIPFLVEKQFDSDLGDLSTLFKSDSSRAELHMSSNNSIETFSSPIRCFTFIAPDASFCIRANSIATFHKVNLKLPFIATSSSSPWLPLQLTNSSDGTSHIKESVMGEGVKVGDHSTIRHSVIGKHCKIGNKVTVENTVILDYTVLEDESIVTDSVLCGNVNVQRGVSVAHSCVAARQTVESDLYKEVVSDNSWQ